MKNYIVLELPIPPTANKQLTVSRGRFIKSQEARIFDSKINKLKIIDFKDIESDQFKVKDWITNGFQLQIDLYFVFNYNRIFSKTKKAKSIYKKIDTNNRIKSSIDAVSKLLGIDDSLFFKESSFKVVTSNNSKEKLIAVVKPYMNITDLDILNLI